MAEGRRKTEDEWIEIVQKQLDSGMRPGHFCEMYKIEYKTFLKARTRVRSRMKLERELKEETSFIDMVQKSNKPPNISIEENVNNVIDENINENIGDDNNYDKLIGPRTEMDEISAIILEKTKYVLNHELNKFINIMGVEKDIRQINVQKLKDLSIAVLKTAYQNDIQKRRLELEIIRSNIEAEKLLIEKEKLHLEKLKLGLVKDESQTLDNGFVEALKEQSDIWEDEEN